MMRRASLLLLLASACAHAPRPLGETERLQPEIVKFVAGQQAPAVLRQWARPVDPADRALPAMIEAMRVELAKSGGVGIAAPQLGVSRRVMLIKHGTRPAKEPHVEAYLNPRLENLSSETELDWEACLSVDGGGGQVRRHVRVTLVSEPVGGGAPLRIGLAGWDARIAQHEMDHLDGVLFIDRLEGGLVPIDEMRKRRDELHREKGWLPPLPPAPPNS